MPCDSFIKPGITPEQRQKQVRDAVAALGRALATGAVKIKVGPQGGITFVGWGKEERDGVSDICAYRKLANSGSWALRQALARAEALAGRKADERAIAAGVHSHDGGATWGTH